jgi:probable rRNA maturation factor
VILFENIDREVPNFDSELFVSALSKLILIEGKTVDAVNVVFCSDEHLLQMNKAYLEHDYYTDIITFDYCVDNLVSGDLFISIDRVEDNARNGAVDFLNELARVCAHGVLHLCGYKDKSEADARLMRSKENEYLPLFGFT